MSQFYGLRIILGIVSGFVEISFVNAISRAFNYSIARYLKIMLIFSPGMFIAAPAFLPSSWAMVCVTLASLGWFMPKDAQLIHIVGWLGVGSLLGWPFAAAIGLPFAAKCLLEFKGSRLFTIALIYLLVISVRFFILIL